MFIEVSSVKSHNNRIDVIFSKSNDLQEYFSNIPFFVEYNEDITNTPDGIAVIPFVTNVLPIIWLFNADLYLDEIDKTFFECIPKIKEGFVKMYPEAQFLGRVHAKKVVDYGYESTTKVTAFFSGGLDATHTLMRHFNENPDLITIFGADLGLSDVDGWNRIKNMVENVGEDYGLKNVLITSSFAEFIAERKLSYKFMDCIHGYWYHNVQHGIGMLGLIAPYAYKYHISKHYIASSYSGKHKVECASDPSIDNELKFGLCSIKHDAYGYSRQEKIAEVINYGKRENRNIYLHVCWSVKDGTNCCSCEKCYRSIAGILVENQSPDKYGLKADAVTLINLKDYMTLYYQTDAVTQQFWEEIKERFIEIKRILKSNSQYYRYINWLDGFDFSDIKRNKVYKLHSYKMKILGALCKVVPVRVRQIVKKFVKIKY